MNNKTTDWEKIFEKLHYYTPTRKKVIARIKHDGNKVSGNSLLDTLDMIKRENFINHGYLGGSDFADSEIFPEVVDENLRYLCHQINSSGFVRTTNCCSGHKFHKAQIGQKVYGYKKYKQEKFPYGYSDPYLSLLFNMRDKRSSTAIKAISKNIKHWGEEKNIITNEIIKTESCMMKKDNKEECVKFKQMGFYIEEHTYSAMFYPEELVKKRQNLGDTKFILFWIEELQTGKWYDFAVSEQIQNQMLQFFQIFQKQFS